MNEPERSKKRLQRRRLIRRVVLVLLSLLGIATVGGILSVFLLVRALEGLGSMFNSPACGQNPAGVESIARIKLPPSNSNLESNCGGLPGIWAEARFDMNPDELDLFLQSTNIEPPLSYTGLPARPESNYFPQNATSIKSNFYGRNQKPEWFEEVIVDTSDSSSWVAYFSLLAG